MAWWVTLMVLEGEPVAPQIAVDEESERVDHWYPFTGAYQSKYLKSAQFLPGEVGFIQNFSAQLETLRANVLYFIVLDKDFGNIMSRQMTQEDVTARFNIFSELYADGTPLVKKAIEYRITSYFDDYKAFLTDEFVAGLDEGLQSFIDGLKVNSSVGKKALSEFSDYVFLADELLGSNESYERKADMILSISSLADPQDVGAIQSNSVSPVTST
jgi:hypothetical protein